MPSLARLQVKLTSETENWGSVSLETDGNRLPIGLNTAKDGSGDWLTPLVDSDGHIQVDVLSGGGAGTQYTEDAAAAADPVGAAQILVRADSPAGVTSADGDNIARRATDYGAAYCQIVDSSGNFVDSFGGGTQYTEGNTDASITGTAIMFESAADTLGVVNSSQPLPTALYASDGTALNHSGGNLLVNVQNFAVGQYGNSDDIAANLTSALVFAEMLVYDGATWDRLRGDATNGALVNLGSNNDVTVTGDALTALQLIDNPVATISATDVMRVAIYDDSDSQITTFGGGTQYTEDAVAAGDPTGTVPILVREDSPVAVAADGDNVAQRSNAYGAAYCQIVDSSGNFIDSFGGAGGTAAADDADFVAGTTQGTPAMGVYESSPTSVTDGDLGTVGITATRELRIDVTSDSSGGVEAVQDTAADLNMTEANSAAILADTANMDTNLGTIAGDTTSIDADTTTIIGHVDGIETLLGTIDTDTSALVVDLAAIEVLQTTIAGDTTSIDGKITACNTGAVVLAAGTDVVGKVRLVTATGDEITEDTDNSMQVTIVADDVGIGGGTQYTEDEATANPQVGNAIMMERDDQLAAVTPVEGDWIGLRGTEKGALWVALADASGDPITSFGGGTQYTEDAVVPANPTGTAMMMERDDALAGLTPAEGDWTHPFATAEGALWTQDFNSDALLADTNAMVVDLAAIEVLLTAMDADTSALAGAVAGSELQVDIVADGAGLATAANQSTIIGHVDGIEALLGTIDTDTGAMVTDLAAIEVLLTGIDSDTNTIQSDTTNILADTTAILADTAAIQTAVELIDDAVYTDDDDWTDDTSKHLLVGGVYQSTPQTVTDGDVAPFNITANGALHTAIQGNIPDTAAGDLAAINAALAGSLDVSGATVTVDLGANNDVTLATLPDTAAGDLAAMVVDLAAIEVLQTTIAGDTTSIDADTTTIIGHVDGIEGLLGTIDADTSGLFGCVSGSELQVDVVAALPAGDNNIGNVDIVSGTVTTVTALTGGGVAHDGVDSGNPHKIGGRSQEPTTALDEVADNDRVDAAFDRQGRMAVWNGYPVQSADINDASSGDNTIQAAAGAGLRIAVMGYHIVSDGTVDFRWEDGAGGTAFTGQIPLQAREGLVAGYGFSPMWVGTANTLLNLELSAAVNVHGQVSFVVMTD